MVIETEFVMPPRRLGKAVDFRFKRRRGGAITMNVWAMPEVEEFFQAIHLGHYPMGEGLLTSKVWQGIKLYQCSAPQKGCMVPRNTTIADYNFAPLCNSISGISGPRIVSLAFLRAVGISKNDGVSVKVNWPIGDGEFDEWQQQVSKAFPEFYRLNLVDQEVSLRINIEQL